MKFIVSKEKDEKREDIEEERLKCFYFWYLIHDLFHKH